VSEFSEFQTVGAVQLVPLLTKGDMSWVVGGRLCSGCEPGGVLHGGGAWPVGGEGGVALRQGVEVV